VSRDSPLGLSRDFLCQMWFEVDYIICSCFLSTRGAICSGEELISVEMTTAAHKVANNVIKFLRWRNSDESGMVAAGFIGVAFDIAEPPSTTANGFLLSEGKLGIGCLTDLSGFSRIGE